MADLEQNLQAEPGSDSALEKDAIAAHIQSDVSILSLNRDGPVNRRLIDGIQHCLRQRLGMNGKVILNESTAHWANENDSSETDDPSVSTRLKLQTIRTALETTRWDANNIFVLDTDMDGVGELHSSIRPIMTYSLPENAADNVRLNFVSMHDAIEGSLQRALKKTAVESPNILVLGRRENVAASKPLVEGLGNHVRFQSSTSDQTERIEKALDNMGDATQSAYKWHANTLMGTVQSVVDAQRVKPQIVVFADPAFSSVALRDLSSGGDKIQIVDATTAYANLIARRMMENASSGDKAGTEQEIAREQTDEIVATFNAEKSWTGKLRQTVASVCTPKNWLKWENWKNTGKEMLDVNGVTGQVSMTLASSLATWGFLEFESVGAVADIATTQEVILAHSGILIGAFAVSAVATFLNAHRDIDTKTESVAEMTLTYGPTLVMGTTIGTLLEAGAPLPIVAGAILTQAMLSSYYKVGAMSRIAQDNITSAFTQISSKMPGLSSLIAKWKTPRPGKDNKQPVKADLLQRQVLTGAPAEEMINTIVESFVMTNRAKGHSLMSTGEQDSYDRKSIEVAIAAASEIPHLSTLLDHDEAGGAEAGGKSSRRSGLKRA